MAAAAAEASAAAAEGTECGAAAVQQDGQKPASKQGSVAPMDVDGPSFELPERLREFTGADNDKKALLQWRQEQQVRWFWHGPAWSGVHRSFIALKLKATLACSRTLLSRSIAFDVVVCCTCYPDREAAPRQGAQQVDG